MSSANDTCCLYFIQIGDDGPIKIGISGDPHERLRRLKQVTVGAPLRLLGVLPGKSRRDEAFVHDHFAELRQQGEWFTASPEMLEVAAGKVWPGPKAFPCLPADPLALDPDVVDMSLAMRIRRSEIEGYAEAGMTMDEVAEHMGCGMFRLRGEVERMVQLGYFRPRSLGVRTPADQVVHCAYGFRRR